MQAVDLNNEMNDFFGDEQRKIPQAHLDSVCKLKQGEKTCRYISLTVNGFICTKKTPIKSMLDQRVLDNKMSAKGDNCEGLGQYEKK